MKKLGRFVFSLATAGYLSQGAQAALVPPKKNDDNDQSTSLFQMLRGNHTYTLAGHRSHSSHRSHGSHRSHRSSSSGGSYFGGRYRSESRSPLSILPKPSKAPRLPKPSKPPITIPKPEALMPQPAPSRPLKTLPGNSEKFTNIVRQVQTALYAYGYYTGRIDGKFGPQLKIALSKFQKDWNLKVTGTITPEVLDALQIVAK